MVVGTWSPIQASFAILPLGCVFSCSFVLFLAGLILVTGETLGRFQENWSRYLFWSIIPFRLFVIWEWVRIMLRIIGQGVIYIRLVLLVILLGINIYGLLA
jgi:hypothetical protein